MTERVYLQMGLVFQDGVIKKFKIKTNIAQLTYISNYECFRLNLLTTYSYLFNIVEVAATIIVVVVG